jgi:hypothetical protein
MRHKAGLIHRHIWSIVACAVLLSGTLPARAASLGLDAPMVTFTVRADSALVGANWLLTGYDTDDEQLPTAVASGVVSAAGPLTFTVGLTALTSLTTAYYEWSALRGIDNAHGVLAIRTTGIARAALVTDAVIDLGTAISHDVPVNAAADAVPTTPGGYEDTNTAPSPWATGSTSAAPTRQTVQGPGIAPLPPTTIRPDTGVADDQTSGLIDTVKLSKQCKFQICNDDAPPHPAGGGAGYKCTWLGGGAKDCIVDDQMYPLTSALRGFSQRPNGARDTFVATVKTGQDWDTGTRYKAGPFEVSGKVHRERSGTLDETWPLRGDCWSPDQPGDDEGRCDGVGGTVAALGSDPWVWERHERQSCAPSCVSTYYEVLRQDGSGGGEQWGSRDNLYYNETPSAIAAGAYGHVGRYPPGAGVQRLVLASERTYIGASFNINPSGGYGSGGFDAGMTTTTLTEVQNRIEFRSDLPFMYQWWRYDCGCDANEWEREFYSCEFSEHYFGACNEYGS